MHTLAGYTRSSLALNSNKKLTPHLSTSAKRKYVRKQDPSKEILPKPSEMSSHGEDPPNPPLQNNNQVPPNRVEVNEEETRPIKDYSMPTGEHNRSSIRIPAANAQTELKTSYIHEVQRNRFEGRPGDNPRSTSQTSSPSAIPSAKKE